MCAKRKEAVPTEEDPLGRRVYTAAVSSKKSMMMQAAVATPDPCMSEKATGATAD